MQESLEFTDVLRLIDERSTAFCAAVAAAPGLDVQVPSCPEWTLFDLVEHLGAGRRAWAATVAAGPDATEKIEPEGDDAVAPREREALLAWMAASTQQLLDALRAAGPDRGCWVWWGSSQSPRTCAAVARHQLQEIAVHAYDAQLTAGAGEPLPLEVAVDGVEEFLVTIAATTVPRPYEPAALEIRITEGRAWRQSIGAHGSRISRVSTPEAVDTTLEGTASDLVLALYGRIPLDALKLDDSRDIFGRLMEWDPDE